MRVSFCLFALVASLLTAWGEEPFSLAKTPGQLPKTVVPVSYIINISPLLEKETFSGNERIFIEVKEPVREIVLNSLGLEITRASLAGPMTDGGPTIGIATPLNPALDEKKQTLTLPLDHQLLRGKYEVNLSFKGKLTEQPFGLFITRYQAGTEQRRALVTQMEATDARRMFPCWDEPVFRATFELSVMLPHPQMAISNMPTTGILSTLKDGQQVNFAKTPPMATYLLALFIGDFEALEDEVDGVKLRVLTTTGKREQGRYALAATKQVLHFYNEYFGVKYPLPKLDQLAVPSTGASGMENWGAILYNDTALLFDPATSSQATRERVYEVVAHEIAHQWFGDLVTMAWWDNLWLNEGFASWMGTKATDHFNPEWQSWLRSAGDKEWAMWQDARKTTHPIQQPVKNESEANDAFDSITYLKGQSFLRMLESYLGETAFRDGIRKYVKDHSYSSTTTADLWAALEEVSGKPVRALATGWTEQPGFPVVKVSEAHGDAATTVELAQERFTLNWEKPDPLFWAVPVVLGPAAAPLQSSVVLLKDPKLPAYPIDAGQALKVNLGDVGYYRVWYDDALFKRLRKALPMMATTDRLNLLNDTWAMALAERAPVARYFELLDALADDSNYVIVDQIVDRLGAIDRLQRGEPGEAPFQAFARQILQPYFANVGWDAKPDEKELDGLLRNSLIGALGTFGDAAVLAETRKRFDAFVAKPESLPGNLRSVVLGLIGRNADEATWETLHRLGKAADSTEQKRLFYRSLAAAHAPALAAKTLALSLTEELVPQMATRLVQGVGDAGEQPALALDFAKAHLEVLLEKVSALGANEFVPSLFVPFKEAGRADELEAFAKAKLPPEAGTQVAKAADEIRFNALLKKRLLPAIDAWCQAHPGK